MFRSSARAACGLALALVVVSQVPAAAQEAVLAEFYGRGVHQYFAGNASQAVNDLTAAINGGTKDPRAFYFRALAEMRQGRQSNAQADLQKGAALESADINQFYPVGKSLERVQGASRMTIERYRTIARAEAFQRQQRRDATRYEEHRRAEARVLRAAPQHPAKPAPTEPAPDEAESKEPAAAADDPFADDAKKPDADANEPPEPMPPDDAAEMKDDAPEAETPAAEKSDDEAKDAPAKADDDPFADEPSKSEKPEGDK